MSYYLNILPKAWEKVLRAKSGLVQSHEPIFQLEL